MILTGEAFYVFACLFVAGMAESTFGFGSALIAMPLMAIVLDLRTASPLMAMISFVLALAVLIRNWRHIQFSCVWRLVVGAVPGIPLGILLLKGPHQNIMKLVLAIIIIGFATYRFAGPRLPVLRRQWPAYFFGFLAGILGGAYNTSGPPVVVYASLKRWEPREFRASLLGFFLICSVAINFGHYRSGYWTPTVVALFLESLPFLLASVAIGSWLHPQIPADKFHRIVYAILILIGLSLLAGTVRSMLWYQP